MGDHDDKVFLKRFSGIIVGLVIVTVLIIVISVFQEKAPNIEDNPSRLAMAKERIAPVAGVRTEMPVPAAAAAAPAQVAQASAAAATPAIDGAAIYAQACQACHLSGAAGAPVPGTDAWAERVAKGAETLAVSAINGIGMMPAKGGRMDLSDAEIEAAVEHMLGQ